MLESNDQPLPSVDGGCPKEFDSVAVRDHLGLKTFSTNGNNVCAEISDGHLLVYVSGLASPIAGYAPGEWRSFDVRN